MDWACWWSLYCVLVLCTCFVYLIWEVYQPACVGWLTTPLTSHQPTDLKCAFHLEIDKDPTGAETLFSKYTAWSKKCEFTSQWHVWSHFGAVKLRICKCISTSRLLIKQQISSGRPLLCWCSVRHRLQVGSLQHLGKNPPRSLYSQHEVKSELQWKEFLRTKGLLIVWISWDF